MFCDDSVPGLRASLILAMLSHLLVLTRSQSSVDWEDPTETGLSFYLRYCGGVCRNGSYESSRTFRCKEPPCFQCDCDSSCSIYGTCCPNIDGYNKLMDLNDLPVKLQPQNLPSPDRYACASFSDGQPYLYMISDCPLHSTDPTQESDTDSVPSNAVTGAHQSIDTIARCENSSMDTLDEVTPYQDLRYGVTFTNKFCAICNGYTIEPSGLGPAEDHSLAPDVTNQAAAWTINVTCYHYQNVYQATSEVGLFKAALQVGTDQCRVRYTQPTNSLAEPRECNPEMHRVTNTTCTSQDLRLQNYCLNSHQKYLRVQGGQNMFCYMCAGDSLWGLRGIDCRKTALSSPGGRMYIERESLLYEVLLHVGSPQLYGDVFDAVQNTTHGSQLTDKIDGQETGCSAGKLLEPDGQCRTKLTNIRGLGYKLFMLMKPKYQNTPVSPSSVKRLVNRIYSAIYNISEEVQLAADVTVLVQSRGAHKQELLQKISFLAHLTSSKLRDRDSVEEDFMNLVNGEWVIDMYRDSSLTLVPSLFGTEYSALLDHATNDTIFQFHEMKGTFSKTSRVSITPITEPSLGVAATLSSVQDPANSAVVKMYRVTISPPLGNSEQWRIKDRFIDVTHSLTCPFRKVNTTSIKRQDNQFTFSFTVKDRTISVSSRTKVSLVDGELRICVDLYQSLTSIGKDTATGKDRLAIATLYIEYGCVLLSVVCLVMTFVTYCLHPTLRTLPGLNNMALSISLAAAQTSLFVTVQFGLPGKLTSAYCLFHAIAVHYFWLASFLWMSASCVHMYRAFTCKGAKFLHTNSNNKRFVGYCLYAFGSPVIIVLLQIVVCLSLTNGQSTGYSSKICFFDMQLFILIKILLLIAPLAFTVLSNGVLFVLTIKEMISVSNLQNRKTDGQSVITYAKLSTLTGILYILGAVAVQFKNPILYLLFSPTMCLQGVFIFLSFTANKRVALLYSGLIRRVGESGQTGNGSEKPVQSNVLTDKNTGQSATRSTSI